jgi:RNA polymerase sigma-70 factor (ECF subfamily)
VKVDPDVGDLDALARAAGDGDAAAFERLVRSIHRTVYRWALVRVGDADDAEDVTQRVFLKLHSSLGGWEGRSRFTTWLYRITANESASWRRKIVRRARWVVRSSAPDGSAEGGPDGRDTGWAGVVAAPGVVEAERRELAQVAVARFRELPSRQRQVMDLVDFQGHAPSDVAEMLQMNPNTVRANLFKARRSLREKILETHPDAGEVLP